MYFVQILTKITIINIYRGILTTLKLNTNNTEQFSKCRI